MTKYLRGVLLVGPSLLFVGHLAYALAHSDLYLNGIERIARYYLGPLAIVALYLLVIWRTSPAVRAQVAAYGYAIIGALLLFELYPYWVSADAPPGARTAVVMELRAAGRDAYPAFTVDQINEMIGSRTRADSVVSNLPQVTTVLCESAGQWVWFDADQDGFNNPPPAGDAGASDVPFAVLGDSFIHGECLPREETIVGQLHARGLEGRNFGIRGHGPLAELETLKRFVAPHQPDDVVWCFYAGNDLDDLERESRTPWLMAAIDAPPFRPSAEHEEEILQRIKSVLDERMASGRFDQREGAIDWSSVLALRRSFLALGLHYGRGGGPIDLFARVMRAAKATVDAWGGRLHLCYLPEFERYAGVLPAQGAYDAVKELVLEPARELDIGIIDVSARFDAHPAPRTLFDVDQVHYTKEGAALAADAIADALRPRSASAAH